MLHPSYSDLMAVANSDVEDENSRLYRADIQLLWLHQREQDRLLQVTSHF